MFSNVKNTRASQLSLQSHIWPWLLSKPYTRVHYNFYRNFCVGANWSRVKIPVLSHPCVFCLFQADSHVPSGRCPAVLLDCLSLCLCEDNIINTHYAVGSLISTKPCDSDLFVLELFARMSNTAFNTAISSSTVFFGSGPYAKIYKIAERNTDFSEFYVC